MADSTPTEPYDVNLGAGRTFIPGFVNIDIHERAEVTLDLSKDKLPFPDDSVRTVISLATLEHVPDYLFALGEIYRVLKHDGVLLLNLPYVTLTEYHLVNPYHLHNFSEHSFDFFDPRKLKGSAVEDSAVTFRRVYAEFRYMNYMGLLPKFARKWARRHLFNVVREFDIALVAIKDRGQPVDVGAARARELKARMAELNQARQPYDDTSFAASRRSSLRSRVLKQRKHFRERRTS